MKHTSPGPARKARRLPTLRIHSLLTALWVLPAPLMAANTVGYSTPTVPAGGYAVLAAQFQSGTNGLNEILPSTSGVVHGTQVWLWNTTSQMFGSPSTFDANSGAWTPPMQIPPGRGFVLWTPPQPLSSNVTLFLSGFLLTGQLTNFVAGSNKLSLIGPMVPQDGSIGGVHQFPGDDGDLIYGWDLSAQRYKDASTYFAGYGWHGGGGTNGPVLAVAEAFFIQKHGPDINWVRSFEAARPAALVRSSTTASTSGCDIRRLNVQGGSAVLEITNPKGRAYDVQFSRDGSSWATVSARGTGFEWKGPFPGGIVGYYRVIESTTP